MLARGFSAIFLGKVRTCMNVILHAKGIFCESGDDGLANILGTLAIEQPFNSAMYSTLDGLASGFDTRPITLAVGDSLVYFANLPITLGFDDIIQIDGKILGFSTLT